MGVPAVAKRTGLVLTFAVLLSAVQGCTYLRYRLDDAKEMGDFGVTWSKKPYVSVHACLLGLASIGGGRMEGQFAGVGGGKAGVMRHYHRNVGLLAWSYSELAWRDFDVTKPDTLEAFHIGPVGWLQHPQRQPPYAFACTKYLHLGYVGLVNNLRFAEMADFLAGWATLDLAGDDGKDRGDWPWRKDMPREKPVHRSKLPF